MDTSCERIYGHYADTAARIEEIASGRSKCSIVKSHFPLTIYDLDVLRSKGIKTTITIRDAMDRLISVYLQWFNGEKYSSYTDLQKFADEHSCENSLAEAMGANVSRYREKYLSEQEVVSRAETDAARLSARYSLVIDVSCPKISSLWIAKSFEKNKVAIKTSGTSHKSYNASKMRKCTLNPSSLLVDRIFVKYFQMRLFQFYAESTQSECLKNSVQVLNGKFNCSMHCFE